MYIYLNRYINTIIPNCNISISAYKRLSSPKCVSLVSNGVQPVRMWGKNRGAYTKYGTPERWSRSVCWANASDSWLQTKKISAKCALVVEYSIPMHDLGMNKRQNLHCYASINTHNTYMSYKWQLVTSRHAKTQENTNVVNRATKLGNAKLNMILTLICSCVQMHHDPVFDYMILEYHFFHKT